MSANVAVGRKTHRHQHVVGVHGKHWFIRGFQLFTTTTSANITTSTSTTTSTTTANTTGTTNEATSMK